MVLYVGCIAFDSIGAASPGGSIKLKGKAEGFEVLVMEEIL